MGPPGGNSVGRGKRRRITGKPSVQRNRTGAESERKGNGVVGYEEGTQVSVLTGKQKAKAHKKNHLRLLSGPRLWNKLGPLRSLRPS